MFKLTDEIRVTRELRIQVPRDGTRLFETKNIKVTFRILANSEEEQMVDDVVSPVESPGPDASAAELAAFEAARRQKDRRARTFVAELLRTVVVGWPDDSGIADEDGKPLAYTPERRDQLIDVPFVQSALITAYRDACAGKITKN
jgi:hypothetical protein